MKNSVYVFCDMWLVLYRWVTNRLSCRKVSILVWQNAAVAENAWLSMFWDIDSLCKLSFLKYPYSFMCNLSITISKCVDLYLLYTSPQWHDRDGNYPFAIPWSRIHQESDVKNWLIPTLGDILGGQQFGKSHDQPITLNNIHPTH